MIAILKKIISIVERLTRTKITVSRKPRIRIKVHPYAVNDGTAMELYVKCIEKYCNFIPKNIFEIGANFGQDAEFLRKSFMLSNDDVYVFEPHPEIIQEVKGFYAFNCYPLAVSNINGVANFNAINIKTNEYSNSGISSLKDGLTTDSKNFSKIEVQTIRMDNFIKNNHINSIDFLKIDVEGANYEVLEGFGKELKFVKAIQIEGERKAYWDGQKLYSDIENLLKINNFTLVYFVLSDDGVQSDSFWIQTPFLKSES